MLYGTKQLLHKCFVDTADGDNPNEMIFNVKDVCCLSFIG